MHACMHACMHASCTSMFMHIYSFTLFLWKHACVFMCIYTHTHILNTYQVSTTCLTSLLYMCIWTCVCLCVSVYKSFPIHTYIYIYTYKNIRILYIYIYIYIYIYTYTYRKNIHILWKPRRGFIRIFVPFLDQRTQALGQGFRRLDGL